MFTSTSFPKVFSGALYICDKFILLSELQELAIGNLTDIKKIPEFNSLISNVSTKTYVQSHDEKKVTSCDLVTTGNKLSLSLYRIMGDP